MSCCLEERHRVYLYMALFHTGYKAAYKNACSKIARCGP